MAARARRRPQPMRCRVEQSAQDTGARDIESAPKLGLRSPLRLAVRPGLHTIKTQVIQATKGANLPRPSAPTPAAVGRQASRAT
jgi:hypothetical protein